MLWKVIRSRNNFHLQMLQHYKIAPDFLGGLYELNRLLCQKEFFYRKYYGEVYGKSSCLIFKVDLKCRKELAPVELLLEFLKEQLYEDNEEESAPGAHTV
jgi:hypothetical protein